MLKGKEKCIIKPAKHYLKGQEWKYSGQSEHDQDTLHACMELLQ
jgi:hypothetical protein